MRARSRLFSLCSVLLGSLAVATGCGDDATGGAGGSGGAGGADEGGAAPIIVETASGKVEGGILGESRRYLGIPYAAPPVGDLRWRAPMPAEPWTDTLEVKTRLPSCSQANPLNGSFATSSSEDCLTLNIWAPKASSATPRPVMFWIHGGAFVLGSGAESAYDGQILSETTGAIVVTINYRLGPLGFLALSSLEDEDAEHGSSGNYGFLDQQAALTWVHDNIAAFGGDPERIAIFGESAGGISVCDHLVSPASDGLFQAAIIESGPCDTALTRDEAHAQGAELLAATGCDVEADPIACLRGKTPQELIEAIPPNADFLNPDGPRWSPVVDDYVLTDQPGVSFATGNFSKVPLIVGSNADEATLFFTLANVTIADEAAFEALAESFVPGHGADVVAEYPVADYGTAKDAAVAAVSDAAFVCPARRTARAVSSAGVPTYLYQFSYGPTSLLGELGAFHEAEVKFVFGVPSQLLPLPLNAEERTLSENMMSYWTELLISGAPGDAKGALAWPTYEEASDQHIVLDLTLSTGSGLEREHCDFWDTMSL